MQNINPILETAVEEKFTEWLNNHIHLPISTSQRNIYLNCWLDGMSNGLQRAQEVYNSPQTQSEIREAVVEDDIRQSLGY